MQRRNTITLIGLIFGMPIFGTLIPATSSAYYLEVRGTTGAQVPVRFADADALTAETVEVEFRINTSTIPTGASAAAIEAAFATWGAADCTGLRFTEGADSTSTDRAHWIGDGDARYVLVYWTDTEEEWGSVPAVGHFYFGFSATVEMIGATVVLNSRDHMWATDGSADALDVQGTVTALIGRAMGITSAMEGNATFPSYSAGDTEKRTLGADDLAAIQYLYVGGGACTEPLAPEAECAEVTLDPCPPLPTTMPPDGGTLPRVDAGPRPMGDAGTGGGTDAGTGGGGDGGCSVGQRSGAEGGGALVFLACAALVLRRRRR